MNAIDMQSQHSQRVNATIEQLKKENERVKEAKLAGDCVLIFRIDSILMFRRQSECCGPSYFGEQHFYCQANLTLFTQCAFEYFFAK